MSVLNKDVKVAFCAIAILALSAVGCSSKVAKTEELSKVKTFAIIGLDVQQQKSVSSGDLADAFLKQTKKDAASPHARIDAAHVSSVYDDLAAKLTAKTGWTYVDVRKNPNYAALFHDSTSGLHAAPIINDRFDLYTASNVLDEYTVMTLGSDKTKALAAQLGVDAIVFASSTVNLNNSSMLASLVGKGEFHPSSNFSIFIVDGHSGEKIFVQSINGPEVAQGEQNTLGMANTDNLNNMAKQATEMAFDKSMEALPVNR